MPPGSATPHIDFDDVYEETGSGLSTPITERMKLGNYDIRTWKAPYPTFRTYNICRWYILNLSLTLQCADKKLSAKYPPHPILVIPHAYNLDDQFLLLGSLPIKLPAKEPKNKSADGVGSSLRSPTEESLPQYTPKNQSADGVGSSLRSPTEESLPQYTPQDGENSVSPHPELGNVDTEAIGKTKVSI